MGEILAVLEDKTPNFDFNILPAFEPSHNIIKSSSSMISTELFPTTCCELFLLKVLHTAYGIDSLPNGFQTVFFL